jgi:hypothetical protein
MYIYNGVLFSPKEEVIPFCIKMDRTRNHYVKASIISLLMNVKFREEKGN